MHGTGYNTLTLVNKAIRLRDELGYNEEGDQVWCVFDRDNFPVRHFNAALEKAREQGLCVAYSNEALEIWYLLQFNYYDTALHRSQYIEKLHGLLGHRYEKNDVGIFMRFF